MKTFFTSDSHFFHANVIQFCNRPFGSVEHMNGQWDVGADANNYTPLLLKDAVKRAEAGEKAT